MADRKQLKNNRKRSNKNHLQNQIHKNNRQF